LAFRSSKLLPLKEIPSIIASIKTAIISVSKFKVIGFDFELFVFGDLFNK